MGGGVVLQFALDHPRSSSIAHTRGLGAARLHIRRRDDGAHRAVHGSGPADGARAAIENVWLQHPFFDGVRRDPRAVRIRSRNSCSTSRRPTCAKAAARPTTAPISRPPRGDDRHLPSSSPARTTSRTSASSPDILAENIQNARQHDHPGLLAPPTHRKARGVQRTPNRHSSATTARN